MKAKNLRIQKLLDAGTEKLYKRRYRTVSMATFLKQWQHWKITLQLNPYLVAFLSIFLIQITLGNK